MGITIPLIAALIVGVIYSFTFLAAGAKTTTHMLRFEIKIVRPIRWKAFIDILAVLSTRYLLLSLDSVIFMVVVLYAYSSTTDFARKVAFEFLYYVLNLTLTHSIIRSFVQPFRVNIRFHNYRRVLKFLLLVPMMLLISLFYNGMLYILREPLHTLVFGVPPQGARLYRFCFDGVLS